MKLIIAKNLNDFSIEKEILLNDYPNEKIEVIFTNESIRLDLLYRRKFKEKDIIITKEASFGVNYNKVIDNIWHRIIKR